MKRIVLLVSGLFVISCSLSVFADIANTNDRPQPPKFKIGTPPDFNYNNQFSNKRPKYKPDLQPGGKMEPKEWSSSQGDNFQDMQSTENNDKKSD